MNWDDIEKILALLFQYGFQGAIAGGALFILAKNFLPSYLSEKGKNLATKEDISDITDKIESIRSNYAEFLEEIKSGHQLKLAAIEREKAIKKEVYMEAVEAFTIAINTIAALTNLNLNDAQLGAFASQAGKIAKVQIVGSGETVKAVTTLMSAIGATILDLMLERTPLLARKNSIELHETQRIAAQGEVDRYVALMKNLNLQGNADKALWDTIERQVKYEQGMAAKYQQERDSLWDEQNKALLQYTRKCMDTFFTISALVPIAVLSVRKELDLPIEPDEYLKIHNDNLELGKRVFDDFLKKIPQDKK